MAGKYADRTKVPVSHSQAEIQRLLKRYGADQFGFFSSPQKFIAGFAAHGRQVRFIIPIPKDGDDAEERRLWRCLVLVIKGKLESVETGIETFEDAFLANIVTPDGRLVGEIIRSELAIAYERGQQPPALLPDYSGGKQ